MPVFSNRSPELSTTYKVEDRATRWARKMADIGVTVTSRGVAVQDPGKIFESTTFKNQLKWASAHSTKQNGRGASEQD